MYSLFNKLWIDSAHYNLRHLFSSGFHKAVFSTKLPLKSARLYSGKLIVAYFTCHVVKVTLFQWSRLEFDGMSITGIMYKMENFYKEKYS